MIKFFAVFLLALISSAAFADCNMVSWNLENLGSKKTPEAIASIAKVLVRAKADVVAIQEVTAGKQAGVQAVAAITDEMNRLRANSYDYVVSEPTKPASPGIERYAFIWMKSSVVVNRKQAALLTSIEEAVDREPFVMRAELKCASAPVIFMSFHAEPDQKAKGKDPRHEIEILSRAPELLALPRVILAGDFNVRGMDIDGFFAKSGYSDAIDVPTSLGVKVGKKGYLRNNFDHFFVKGITVKGAHVIDFVGEMGAGNVDDMLLKKARVVSDHLPIFVTFN